MALNLIMLGPPGAGKGTQAARLSSSRGLAKISTGDILREAVKAGTELGRRAKVVMDRGELVSDDVMIGIVRERLDRADAAPGFVLDGFPRTVAQAAVLDGIMNGRAPLIVVDIQVPDPELVRRLTGRLICAACGANAPEGLLAGSDESVAARCGRCGGSFVQRADDTESVVLDRLRVYQKNTRPLIEYYQSRPTFCAIEGSQTADRVAAAIAAAVDGVSQLAASDGHGERTR